MSLRLQMISEKYVNDIVYACVFVYLNTTPLNNTQRRKHTQGKHEYPRAEILESSVEKPPPLSLSQ